MAKESRIKETLEKEWNTITPLHEEYILLGPYTLRLLFATRILREKILRAFQHLKTAPTISPHLTVHLWDTTELQRPLPSLDWELLSRNGYQGAYTETSFYHFFSGVDALSVVDANTNTAYFVVRDAIALPWWVSGSPLQALLHAWLRTQGMQLTHVASVGKNGKALLLAGKGGSGKSTTTLACAKNGFTIYGEDYCIIDPSGEPKVYSIYQTAKIESKTFSFFPSLPMHLKSQTNEKSLLFYDSLFPETMGYQASIKGIFSLHIGEKPIPSLSKSGSCLQSLLMSTLRQLPFYHSKSMQLLHQLTSQTENYTCTLGTDMNENIRLIERFFE